MTSLMKFRVLMSLLMSRVSCPSPWARQNFPTPLKIKQILSHRKEKYIPHRDPALPLCMVSTQYI